MHLLMRYCLPKFMTEDHIVRERRAEIHLGSGNRMTEGEAIGMESLAADHRIIRIVQKITGERMPDVFHVYPDLVGPSGFQRQGGK